jgi:hypothetical protein
MKERIEAIIKYELASMTSGSVYPIVKVVNYFGVEEICKAYGCAKYSEVIAKELVRIAFDEADE